MEDQETRALEALARRVAKQAGYRARKSRMTNPLDNRGGFMLTGSHGLPVPGFHYDLAPEGVIAWCADE